jgi:putative addiction module component (TIGR02574 family)
MKPSSICVHLRHLRMKNRYTGSMSSSPSILLAEARKLSPGERLDLIAEIWDTLESSDLPVTDEERAILESRMADLEANASAQEPWEQARASLESRRP